MEQNNYNIGSYNLVYTGHRLIILRNRQYSVKGTSLSFAIRRTISPSLDLMKSL